MYPHQPPKAPPVYLYEEYPKWKYHPSKEPVIVQSAEEESRLGDNWFDHPALAEAAHLKVQAELKKTQYDRP